MFCGTLHKRKNELGSSRLCVEILATYSVVCTPILRLDINDQPRGELTHGPSSPIVSFPLGISIRPHVLNHSIPHDFLWKRIVELQLGVLF